MPLIHFYKYQGTGNDFIFIDNRLSTFDKSDIKLMSVLCDRKFGIGADGIVLIENHPVHDFEMIYFNPDGSQSFCGNASRCAVHFAQYLQIIKEKAVFKAIDGIHSAHIQKDLIHLKMNDVNKVKFISEDIFIHTGSPHYIKFINDVRSADVVNEGKKIRYSDHFKKEGTNVNFAEILDKNQVYVRTYERGVEDETLSCGTGVTAVALAISLKNFQSPVNIKTPGGDLQVSFKKKADSTFEDVYLIGPAKLVFKGEIEV